MSTKTEMEIAARGYKPLTREGLREYFEQSAHDKETDRVVWDLDTLITLMMNVDHEAFKAGYEHATRWIPVSERLPKIDQDNSGNHPHLHEYMQSERVLACFKDEDMDGEQVFTGRFVSVLREKQSSSHEQWFESDSEGSVELEDITHWQPITLPHKTGSGE